MGLSETNRTTYLFLPQIAASFALAAFSAILSPPQETSRELNQVL